MANCTILLPYCVRRACYEFVSEESVRKVTIEQFISSGWDIKKRKEGRKKGLKKELASRNANSLGYTEPRLRDQRTTTWIRLRALNLRSVQSARTLREEIFFQGKERLSTHFILFLYIFLQI